MLTLYNIRKVINCVFRFIKFHSSNLHADDFFCLSQLMKSLNQNIIQSIDSLISA